MISKFLAATLCCLLFLGVLVIIELFVRRGILESKISRRLAHVASGLFSLIMWLTFSREIFLACSILLIIFIIWSYVKRILHSVHNVERRTHGEIYLPIGILVTFFIANNRVEIFFPAILIMTFADVASGLISDWRDKGRPSKLGSVGFFIVTLIILNAFGTDIISTFSIALILTSVERISPYGSDNVTIPIAASLLLLL